jgi:hypothetical protein
LPTRPSGYRTSNIEHRTSNFELLTSIVALSSTMSAPASRSPHGSTSHVCGRCARLCSESHRRRRAATPATGSGAAGARLQDRRSISCTSTCRCSTRTARRCGG